jgi:lysozyme
MADLTPGIDVSHWEGEIYWKTVRDSGLVEFAFIKATDGEDFIDPNFAANKSGIIAASLPWGAYHFFQPDEDPVVQANFFVKTVGANCPVYVCDCETHLLTTLYSESEGLELRGRPLKLTPRLLLNRLLGTSSLVSATKLFLDTVEARTGRKPVIYTSPYFWNSYMLPNPTWASQYDLWVAHWTTKLEPLLPNGWSTWTFWQYSDDGIIPGIPSKVDLDRFNGNLLLMRDYFKVQLRRIFLPFIGR